MVHQAPLAGHRQALGSDAGVGRGLDGLEISQRCLGLGDQSAERFGLGDREIAQHLTVDCNLGLDEAVNKATIGQTVFTDGSVDTLDPQSAEIALLVTTVAIRILIGLFDGLLSNTDRRLTTAIIALGGLQDLLVTGVGGYASFYACHLFVSFQLNGCTACTTSP